MASLNARLIFLGIEFLDEIQKLGYREGRFQINNLEDIPL